MSLHDVIPGSPQGPRRRSQRAAEKRRKKRRRRTWVTVLVVVPCSGSPRPVPGSRSGRCSRRSTQPDDYPGPGSSAVTVRIPPGATGTDIATLLQEKDVVKTAKAYRAAAATIPDSAGIQPGTYALKLHMTSQAAVQALLDPAARLVKKVTIPEGSTAQGHPSPRSPRPPV